MIYSYNRFLTYTNFDIYLSLKTTTKLLSTIPNILTQHEDIIIQWQNVYSENILSE